MMRMGLDMVQMLGFVDRKPAGASGGQQQYRAGAGFGVQA